MNEIIESKIAELKSIGCSKITTIVQIANIYKIGLNEAKVVVHNSRAWSHIKIDHDKFQDELCKMNGKRPI